MTKEEKKEYNRQWHLEHKEEKSKRDRIWRQNNPEKVKTKNAKYYQENKQKAINYSTNWQKDNPEKLKTHQTTYQQTNKERIKDMHKKWIENNLEKWMRMQAKTRAKKLGLPFNLEHTDIVIPQVCPILGIPIFRQKGKRTINSPSLDRIIPEYGYTKGNIQVISDKANRIKNDASIEELILIGIWASKMNHEKNATKFERENNE